MSDFSNPIFHDDTAAREYLESLRWANGRFCPHCGEAERTSPVAGESHRPGLYVCLSCKKTFTVTVGTLMERSHIPLHKWVAAFVLLTIAPGKPDFALTGPGLAVHGLVPQSPGGYSLMAGALDEGGLNSGLPVVILVH